MIFITWGVMIIFGIVCLMLFVVFILCFIRLIKMFIEESKDV